MLSEAELPRNPPLDTMPARRPPSTALEDDTRASRNTNGPKADDNPLQGRMAGDMHVDVMSRDTDRTEPRKSPISKAGTEGGEAAQGVETNPVSPITNTLVCVALRGINNERVS